MKVPFLKPFFTGKETEYIQRVLDNKAIAGDGGFSIHCHGWLKNTLGTEAAFLTPSGTAALEMAALLLDLKEGDEVIMPSFTFPTTATAFVLRGCTPVFVNIRSDTQNIDESLIEAAITEKTRAIVVVHYAGIACAMNEISLVAEKHNLPVVEDAAHALLSRYQNKNLGSFGCIAALSFHETKNISAGEAGALLINDTSFIDRAEIIREKGTNRNQFFRGEIDKYTWVDIGSSYLPSELQAAYLWAQLEEAEKITRNRREIWNLYHQLLTPLATAGIVQLPHVPENCELNGHIYYIIVADEEERKALMEFLKNRGISTVFHYVPLHSSPAGKKIGKAQGDFKNTDRAGQCLLRLPLWVGMKDSEVKYVADTIESFYEQNSKDRGKSNFVANKSI